MGQTTSDNLYLGPSKILLSLNPPSALSLWPSYLFSLAVISHGNTGLWKIKQASNSPDSPGPCPEPPSTCCSSTLAHSLFTVHRFSKAASCLVPPICRAPVNTQKTSQEFQGHKENSLNTYIPNGFRL